MYAVMTVPNEDYPLDYPIRTFDSEPDALAYASECLSHGVEVDTYRKDGDDWTLLARYWPTALSEGFRPYL